MSGVAFATMQAAVPIFFNKATVESALREI
jgi:hypothetical protein